LLLLGGLGAGAHFMGLTAKLFGGDKHEAEEKEQAATAQSAKPTVFYNLPEMLVNLNTAGRRTSFLKISVSLELENAGDIPRIEAVMPRIVDNFQIYLRELRVEDLRGSAGLYRLREELLARVNNAAQPARVNDVLFKEMLVQ
jgi:flagellar FliL protein